MDGRTLDRPLHSKWLVYGNRNQTEINVLTGQWQPGLFNVKRSTANVRPTCVYGSWQLTDWITVARCIVIVLSHDAMHYATAA